MSPSLSAAQVDGHVFLGEDVRSASREGAEPRRRGEEEKVEESK